MTSWAEWVSLGGCDGGCEMGFQMSRYTGQDSSHFFTWRSAEFPILLNAIRNRFAGAFAGRHPDPILGCFREEPYGVRYHPLETLEEDRSKAEYMLGKFYNPTGPRVYFRKQYFSDIARRDLIELCSHLESIHPDLPFRVVIVRERGKTQDFDIPFVIEREVERFAPVADTTQADEQGWNRIFQEFPLVHDSVAV